MCSMYVLMQGCYIFRALLFHLAVVSAGRCDLTIEYGFQKRAFGLEGILRVGFGQDNWDRTIRTVFRDSVRCPVRPKMSRASRPIFVGIETGRSSKPALRC